MESRLLRFVRNLEEEAQCRDGERVRVDDAKRQRRREWEEALPRARATYLRAFNRTRLQEQLVEYAEALRLRSYADAVAAHAKGLEPGVRVDV